MIKESQKYLIVIGGPTASGKTSFAIKLAKHYDTVILSADSRQFFKEMKVGTARPSKEELAAVPHHFIANKSIQEAYSVGDFEKDALKTLDQIFQTKNIAVLVGGSGLYIKALCEGLNEFPEVPESIKQQVIKEYEAQGIEFLQEELQRLDPVYHQQVDLHNPHRLIRAITICRVSGKPFTHFWTQQHEARSFIPIYIQMQWPRAKLYDRINRRVEIMLKEGLEEEAKKLIPYQTHTALQTVGYQEFFDYFNGAINKEKAIELIKRNSRRYAKRQMTWYRRDPHWKRFHPSELDTAISYVEAFINENVEIITITKKEETHKPKSVLLQQKEEKLMEIHCRSRKALTLSIIHQWKSCPMQWQYWLLQEAGMQHIDDTLIFYAPQEVPGLPKNWIVNIYSPNTNEAWLLRQWEEFSHQYPDARAYSINFLYK